MKNLSLLCTVFHLLQLTIYPQWSGDPGINTPICTAQEEQNEVVITSNEQGGAIIAWCDYRNNAGNNESDIYVQQINSRGYSVWDIDGIALNVVSAHHYNLKIISDGAGGAIIVWMIREQPGVYETIIAADRIDSEGNDLWGEVAITYYAGLDSLQDIISDGNGGAIIVWQRSLNQQATTDIYAQRINADGIIMWDSNGLAVCEAPEDQGHPQIVSDNAGGAYLVWDDFRNGEENIDIYAQRLDGGGNLLWQTDGIPVCTDSTNQSHPVIVVNTSGSAIVAWGSGVQLIDPNGLVQWGNYGVSFPASHGHDFFICNDEDNGAIIFWAHEQRGSEWYYLKAGRINVSGDILWTTEVSDNGHGFSNIFALKNPAGGIITFWNDRAQWLDNNGNAMWDSDGVSLFTHMASYPARTNDGLAGSIVAWSDGREGHDNTNVYAQNIDYNGFLGTDRIYSKRSDVGKVISSTQPAIDTILIEENGITEQLTTDVSIKIDKIFHSSVSDLEFTLAHNSIYDTLIYRVNGNGGEHFKNTALNDDLGDHFDNSSAPFSGYFLPYKQLATFRYLPIYGEWILTVKDYQPGNNGILEGWSLVISGENLTNVVEDELNLPEGFALSYNYPNPFNPSTTIKYQTPVQSFVTLKLFDVLGNEIATLVNEQKPADSYEIQFNASNLPSGIYFYRLQAGSFVETKKMVLMK